MTSPSAGQRPSQTPLIAGVLAFLWLIHWLPFLFPRTRLWGFDHLLYLPIWGQILFITGGVGIAVLLIPSIQRKILNTYSRLAEQMFSDSPRPVWAIVSLCAIVVFWFFRPELFWLGDCYSVPLNIGGDIPVVYKWSEIGAIFVANTLASVIPQEGGEIGRLVYAVISVISGGTTLYLFFHLANLLAEESSHRLFLWSVMVFGGWQLLFFGYMENYPILWPFMVGYVYFSVAYILRRASLLLPMLFLLLALVIHLQTLFFIGSFIVLIFARGKGARFYYQNRSVIWAGIIVILGAGIFSLTRLYLNSLEFRLFLIPFLTERPPAMDYLLFSVPHLADSVNFMLLTSPLMFLCAVLSARYWRKLLTSKVDIFLALLTVGGIAFLLLIDPKLGMGRDWDLFALAGFFPAVWLAYRAVTKIQPKYCPACVLAGIVFAFPFIATHLSASSAEAHTEALLYLDTTRARTGMIMLKEYYTENNERRRADSLDREIQKAFPEYTLVPMAYDYLEARDIRRAWLIADSVSRINPYSTEVLCLRGNIFLQTGQYDKAVADFEIAASLGQYDARMLSSLGSAYSYSREFDKGLEKFREALVLDPNFSGAFEGIATTYYGVRKYDSALYYVEKFLRTDSSKSEAFMLAGFSAYQLNQAGKARLYFRRFLAMDPESSFKEHVENTMATIR